MFNWTSSRQNGRILKHKNTEIVGPIFLLIFPAMHIYVRGHWKELPQSE